MGKQVEARNVAAREDEIDDRADVLHRSLAAHDGRIF